VGIQGREYTVGQILNAATGRVEVPRHQRPYSWEATELKELWQDLTTFSHNFPDKTIDKRQYFLGSIVGQTKDSGRTLEVLDGQQRLATLTILLAAIRDVLHDVGRTDLAQKVHLNWIASTAGALDAPDEYILKLSKLDDSFFRQAVLAYPPDQQKTPAPKTASHKALLRAKSFFRTQIDQLATDDGLTPLEVVQRLHLVITTHLTVVRVSSETWDDVTDIFERLNDRGKGLSTLDLLRVYLIGRAPKETQADVEDAWSTIYELSQSATKVDAFLRHSWITHRGDVKSRSLYKEIKSVLDAGDQPAPLNNVSTFSQSLALDAELYRELVESKHPDDRCAYWLRAISTLGASSLLPAALAGRANTNISDDEFAALLKRLVTAFMRWNVLTGGESTELEEAAFQVAQLVRKGGIPLDEATAPLRAFLRDDTVVTDSFRTLQVARSGYQRYILEALEDKLANPNSEVPVEKPVAGSGTLWIEHIYPQSPADHWGKWEAHDEYLNRIGNLTLIHKKLNAGAKNKDLSSKRPYYSGSGLVMNGYFEDLSSWSPQSIDDRQNSLAPYAIEIWPTF
jgi:hypothetical protein